MTNDKHHFKAKALLEKYLEGRCTQEEAAWVEQWYLDLNNTPNDLTEEQITNDLAELQTRLSRVPQHRRLKINHYISAAAAAAVVLIMLSVVFIWNRKSINSEGEKATVQLQDILPGGNRATLSLNGGDGIVLSEQQQGLIIKSGTIAYNDGTTIETVDKIQMATLTTPVAGQYQVILPDGTHAWLNAVSSITYPTQFANDKRAIQVTGEVYLEVAKDPNKPFIVTTSQQQIEVLGTSFNINAYGDNGKTLTTLSEGSIKLTNTSSNSNVVLKPGHQAIVTTDRNIEVRKVDSEEASSWRYGTYIVNNETLEQYARQIERWYDVQVDMQPYENVRLSAIISRSAKLSEVLQAIELKTGVKFKIEGRRVTAVK